MDHPGPTFRCSNCGKTRPAATKAETDWLAQSVLFFLTKTTVSPVCSECARQVRSVGRFGLALAVIFVGVWLLHALG